MSAAVTLLWAVTLGLWCAQYVSTYEFNFKNPDGSEIHNISMHCKNSDCVVKCCPEKEIMLYKLYEEKNPEQICVKSAALVAKYGVKNPNNYSDIALYKQDSRLKVTQTRKTANDVKFIYDSKFIVQNISKAQYVSVEDNSGIKTYLLEGGKWFLKVVNYMYKYTIVEPHRFCIEHEVTLEVKSNILFSTKPSVIVWVIPDEKTEDVSNRRAVSSAYAMLVSCFFLLLVLAVYAALPELRNLAGMMLMACTATYFAFFLIRMIQVFSIESENLSDNGCVTLTIIFYYLTLAIFCWMNVMSFDIWWKFRSLRKSYQINRRGVMCKFLWYCAYAWGTPVLPTLFAVVVDTLDLKHLENFVTPHIVHKFCFFTGESHWFYVSLPVFLLICVNLLFFAMTSFNIWQVKRRINMKDSCNNQKDEYRFLVYLKLSLVMGVSWMLEVIGNLVDKNSRWWTISDLYNALVGLFIFLIFVCKRKIFLRLCERFSIDNRVVRFVRERADDSRAPYMQTKTNSQTTDTSDVRPN